MEEASHLISNALIPALKSPLIQIPTISKHEPWTMRHLAIHLVGNLFAKQPPSTLRLLIFRRIFFLSFGFPSSQHL